VTIVLDTSGFLAAIDESQRFHESTREVLEEAQTSLVLSPFVLAELDYLVPTRIGLDAEVAVLGEVERGAYQLEPFSVEEVKAARQLIERYSDLGIGLADASNVVLAHRHDTLDILTLDQRRFRTLTGPHGQPFRLLPLDP
jgi:predicted nucleic acid-binding protein